ncbi:endonuclease MutS2 [Ligilactobacillus ceti]|uniref:Endonuclease MutS2 n=1 Tax=Ligilactobacillus ceti DSM 22408 TaxID=1122146 RepID=A0A0R2KHZ9_9LACO|nr:endonuclease MutS2 [Ligilactobacillus ceti]KRN89027.1 dna mismatch repair protein [Ligilactobacillus ceti DSM 22408]
MNSKILQTLEYTKIKQKVNEQTVTEMGRVQVQKMEPQTDFATIEMHLQETKDAVEILRVKGGMPLSQLTDITAHLKRLKIGAVLNGNELAQISKLLRTSQTLKNFFNDLLDEEELTLQRLDVKSLQLDELNDVNSRLFKAIDDDGMVTDRASATLSSIRRQISGTESQIREKLGHLTKGSAAQYLSNAVVTIRNDRYVLPVKIEYRGKFGGVVHDQSSSGQTLFIEPKVIVDLNNRLKQQKMAEKEEIQRILRELSALLAPYIEELANNSQIIGELDYANAKAKYAKLLKATEPKLSAENYVYLREVYHPLLTEKQAVRNTITLGEDYQAIVITGPNTGGKTITLKTLGLVQLMGQSGLFIPAYEGSRIGIFTEIFADIGDEQSIEQSLSTFSSHMTNIISILEQIDEKSLVLFDELGAGTDPQEGAALAIAILDAVGTKGSYVVATTHYPELKAYGYERPATINASMEFNVDTLQPTYRLLMGIPGRSNALDISLRLGLDPIIVQAAKGITSTDSQTLDQMIADLVQKRQIAEEESLALQSDLKQAEHLHAELEKEYHQYLNQKDQLMQKAKQEANEVVAKAEKQAQEIITELRNLRLNANANVKEDQLISAKSELNNLHHDLHLQKNRVLKRAKLKQTLQPNDDVLVKSYGQQGVLIKKLNEHEWEVQLGILKMKINEADLEKINVKNEAQPQKTIVHKTKSKQVSPTLDLRGQRYEEALTNVDRYFDSALLAGYGQITLIHGKGTGALRNGIIKYLKNNRAVKKFEYAPPNAGGNGATIVYFK